jgi:hypothetical protein
LNIEYRTPNIEGSENIETGTTNKVLASVSNFTSTFDIRCWIFLGVIANYETLSARPRPVLICRQALARPGLVLRIVLLSL